MSNRTQIPNENNAKNIVHHVLGESAIRTVRFPTGNHHYVYDIVTTSGRSCVVRLTLPTEYKHFEGALYWTEHLRPLGVPLPDIIASDLTGRVVPFPYLLMERLRGDDLGQIYSDLSSTDKQTLAAEIAAIHHKLASLPQGKGFGYAFNYHDPFPQASWPEVIQGSLNRSRLRILKAGIFDPDIVAGVERMAIPLQDYFASIRPVPFLHDTTTKNVIIEKGKLSGIVDIDTLCFGDGLLTPALTNMALLSSGQDTDYIEYWLKHLALTNIQRHAFICYTAQFCVDFIGEIGQIFNGNAVNSDNQYCQKLLDILEELLNII